MKSIGIGKTAVNDIVPNMKLGGSMVPICRLFDSRLQACAKEVMASNRFESFKISPPMLSLDGIAYADCSGTGNHAQLKAAFNEIAQSMKRSAPMITVGLGNCCSDAIDISFEWNPSAEFLPADWLEPVNCFAYEFVKRLHANGTPLATMHPRDLYKSGALSWFETGLGLAAAALRIPLQGPKGACQMPIAYAALPVFSRHFKTMTIPLGATIWENPRLLSSEITRLIGTAIVQQMNKDLSRIEVFSRLDDNVSRIGCYLTRQ